MKKRITAILLALMLLCIPTLAAADEAYDVISHDVHITVSENNVVDVVERMVLDYVEQRHGFYYYLQYGGTAYYEHEGEEFAEKYKHGITGFKVHGYQYETSRESYDDEKYLVAKIGDADEYVYGEQEYVISYQSNMGSDGHDNFDMFYRNLVYCEIGETIENVSFIIELPKDFDESKVDFTVGSYGGTDSGSVQWEKDGNTIRGYLTRPMQGSEILTLQIVLPDGYFDRGQTGEIFSGNLNSEAISDGIGIICGILLIRAFVSFLNFFYG